MRGLDSDDIACVIHANRSQNTQKTRAFAGTEFRDDQAAGLDFGNHILAADKYLRLNPIGNIEGFEHGLKIVFQNAEDSTGNIGLTAEFGLPQHIRKAEKKHPLSAWYSAKSDIGRHRGENRNGIVDFFIVPFFSQILFDLLGELALDIGADFGDIVVAVRYKKAKAFFGRHSPGRGVRRSDHARFFKVAHLTANRGRRKRKAELLLQIT